MSVSNPLERLEKLRADGVMSEEEFGQAKANLIEEGYVPICGANDTFNANQWAMCIHLSQFSSMLLGPLGIIMPIVLWQMKKEDSAFVDANGRNVTNWIISCCIYTIVSFALCFLVVGFILLPIVLIVSLVFPVIAALNARDGKLWAYPLSIKFFK